MISEPRWLDAEAAADYLSLRVDAFTRAVGAGRVPAPSRHLGPRTPRWPGRARYSTQPICAVFAPWRTLNCQWSPDARLSRRAT
jgi:hypothetical protein